MRDAARGTLVGLAVIAVAAAVASRAGWTDVPAARLAGPEAWLVSRATGWAAFAALSLDVVVGLVTSTRLGDRWLDRGAAVDLHRWLSPVGLGLVAGHALALIADGYARFDLIDVIVPFAAPYRPVAVGIGVIAAYLAVVVHVSFALRKRIGPARWRQLHYVSFAVFAAIAVHVVAAGTDAGRAWAVAIVAAAIGGVAVLTTHRFTARRRNGRRGAGAAGRTGSVSGGQPARRD